MADDPPLFRPCAGATGVYALQADGAQAPYGWVGYVLSPGDSPPSGEPITPGDAFSVYQGSYLFAAAAPAGLAALQGNCLAFLQAQVQRSTIRGLIWLPDPALANPLPGDAPSRFTILFLPSFPGNILQTRGNFSLWLGPDNGFTFSVLQNSQVGWSEANQAISFAGSTGYLYNASALSIIPSAANAGLVVAHNPEGDTLVPLTGNRAGSLTLTTVMEPSITFPALVPSLAFWANNAGTDIAAAFPLIDQSTIDQAATLPLATALDPLDPLNLALPQSGPVTLAGGQIRTGFAIAGPPPTWRSWFCSLDGRWALLTALGGSQAGPFDGPPDFAGGFAFMAQQPWTATPAPGTGAFRLTPSGDYGIGIDGVPAGTAGQTLLPGLFGSERFNFTSWNAAEPAAGARLRFIAAQPAYAPVFPFPDATMIDPAMGTIAKARLTGTYRTAWASLLGAAPLYQAEPDGGAYYGGTPAAGAPLLGATPPATPVPQQTGSAVPIAPYAAYVPQSGWGDQAAAAAAVSAFESQILSATRKAFFGGAGSPARAARALQRDTGAAADGAWTTTRQGLLAEVATIDGASHFLDVTLAQYQPRAGGSTAPFGFPSPTAVLQEALQTSQLFVAAVNPLPLDSFSQKLDIAEWEFNVVVGQGVQPTDYSNVVLLKYCDGPLIDWVKNPNKWTDPHHFSLLTGADESISLTGLSTWLAAYLQDAIDKGQGTGPYAGKPNLLYANIAAIATQVDWRGFLALRASLPPGSALPPQIEGLAAGIDPTRFYAHHFGATLSRVKPNPDSTSKQTLIIDGVSSLFGLIDYQDPLYLAALAANSDPDTPLLIDATDPYAFRVLNLQALFVNARMTSFQSRIQVTLNQLFGAAVRSTSRADPARPGQWLLQPANGVVLDGSAVSQNGATTYVFQQDKPSLFTFDTPALNAITIARVQFNTLGLTDYLWPSGPAPTITSRFLFWGAFDFPALLGTDGTSYDILSFGSGGGDGAALGEGLAFANLQLTMRSPQATPVLSSFDFDPSALAFDLAGSTLRAGSLFRTLSLQLQSFIAAPADKAPLDYGFLTVGPQELGIAALSGPWCGIVHKINMGGPGALVSAAGFSSQLLIAWSPVPGKQPALFVGLSLPGTAPGASVFSLQGVFKISTGPILLQRAAPSGGATLPNFSIELSNIGATFLGIKKIPDATIKFFLFGDPEGTGSLGWYASWNEASNKTTPAKPKLVALGGTEQ